MMERFDPLYLLLGGDVFESVERYAPEERWYIEPVRALLPAAWTARAAGVWCYCTPPAAAVPAQGWKIHVSGTTHSAPELLAAVVPVLVRNGVSFKFAADRRLLSLINSKRWSRGGSGKFLTVYPRDAEQFVALLAQLDSATASFVGPYILSDRRYRDSTVLFYRYGTLQPQSALAVTGRRVSVFVNPDGSLTEDERSPLFRLPPDVVDPLCPEPPSPGPAGPVHLHDGRYRIEAPLAFSNSGGVYRALDLTSGAPVVLKEARPYTNWVTRQDDAPALLRKEARILAKLAGGGFTPAPVEIFEEWEHTFVAQELVPGIPLGTVAASRSILLRTRAGDAEIAAFRALLRRVFTALLHALEALHAANVVFGDLSPNNVMWDDATGRLTLIDFESACELGVDRPARIATPGFEAPAQSWDAAPAFADDWYACGAMLVAFLMPITPFFGLARERTAAVVAQLCADAHLPAELSATLAALLTSEPERRSGGRELAVALAALDRPAHDELPPPDEVDPALRERLASFILSSADTARDDRLYPADLRVFETNPLSVSFGAAGVLRALHRSGVAVPDRHVDWVLSRPVTAQQYPPGLLIGSAGIAWSLLELGLEAPARAALATGHDHPLRDRAPAGIAYGMAGWGLANLKFFLALGDERYLREARRAGDELVAGASKDGDGLSWPFEGRTSLGLFHGASGVALFLLYLGRATGQERYAAAAQRALAFDLAHAVTTADGGSSWPYTTGDRRVVLPYLAYGSAGIGAVALRATRLAGSQDLDGVLEAITIDTDHKYSVAPGTFLGLAGIGTFLVDAHAFTGEARYRTSALRVLDGILTYRIERDAGLALPGEYAGRISCDYGTGSAGVLCFVDRLVTGRPADFFLDEYFAETAAPPADRARPHAATAV